MDQKGREKVQRNLKDKTIITNTLGLDEFLRVSHCKIVKEVWETLQATHEGTTEVNRVRMNTLSHEYELFMMKYNENICDM